jgi:hypothetical protein
MDKKNCFLTNLKIIVKNRTSQNTTRRTQDNKYIYLLPRLVLGGTEGMGARAVPTFS